MKSRIASIIFPVFCCTFTLTAMIIHNDLKSARQVSDYKICLASAKTALSFFDWSAGSDCAVIYSILKYTNLAVC